MLLDWFDAKTSKEFGAVLATEFIERFERTSSRKKLSEPEFINKVQKSLQRMALLVQAFKRENKLNIYKKAQLGNAFKWTLRDAGIDPEYIDHLTRWLMVQIG